MARRKVAGNPWEAHAMLLIGALEEIRREKRQMKGGWPARVEEILTRHLGPDPLARERLPCP